MAGIIRNLTGLPLIAIFLNVTMAASGAQPVVPDLEREVAPEVQRLLDGPNKDVLEKLRLGKAYPGLAKVPVRITGITAPWKAMTDLEALGLEITRAARRKQRCLGPLLDRLAVTLGHKTGKAGPEPRTVRPGMDGLIDHITDIFDRAAAQRNKAMKALDERERNFVFRWGPRLLKNYGPQVPFSRRALSILKKDLAFCTITARKYDWPALIETARTLAVFTGNRFRQRIKVACFRAPLRSAGLPGVKGRIHASKKTPHGWIIIGGKGKNTYDLEEPAALIVDPGGNDTYNGIVASSCNEEHTLSVVVDLAGNDRYEAKELGLATGRMGVGLLYDAAGRDVYELAEASGGVGLGGIGILLDAAGDDTYTGSKFTQGFAIGGIGLVLDEQGNDEHTSFGYAIGLGGCGGVGAVIDVKGDDQYRCGGHYPSGYNSQPPHPRPGDPLFQYTAFGMGTGLGRRIIQSNDIKDHVYALAGGVGMVIDIAGKDRYESSNFSQGCGYYFGVGLKMDLAGDDIHSAARYGHAAGAHFGMGLFIDYRGKDVYGSTGPTYNCGCAWDHSIFLCVDGGRQDDLYDLARSAGLGRADIGSWSVFADLGGKDHYRIRTRLGHASRTGVGVFYDRAGKDVYEFLEKKAGKKPGNGRQEVDDKGRMFWDR